MSELTLGDAEPGFADDCHLVGRGQKADSIWTKHQFIALGHYMMNSNPKTEFMHVYRDEAGNPKFTKSKNKEVRQRIFWAWDSITGRAARNVGIGFYPSNQERLSRWGALDFDAHDGDTARARRLAIAALAVLRPEVRFHLVLTTSGSSGWHLFVFSTQFHPIAEWTRLLKQVASLIGTEVRPGCCEVFPNEPRGATAPYGIRAPGTWNPKTDQFGLIVFSSISSLISLIRREKEESPFPYHSVAKATTCQLNDRESFYSGGPADWQHQFAILQPGTRHTRLKDLVCEVFRQVGHDVALWNAEAQFLGSRVPTNAVLADHLAEFEELWAWLEKQWVEELTAPERSCFNERSAGTEKDLFRVLLNFARNATTRGESDFPFSIENVADRLGNTFQYVSTLRKRFARCGLIVATRLHVPNRFAARYRWCVGNSAALQEQPMPSYGIPQELPPTFSEA